MARAPGLFLLLALLGALVPDGVAADDRLPLDPAVRTGVLDNGLRYVVRHNERPENRVELRLVVDAGSILEEDDQQGLAHFLEHMAFNGTANFPPGELVDYLESIGSRFGPDLNAYTSFDETVYMLQIPTDREGLLERGMLVLADWAGRMTLDPGEVAKEAGVVLEEWRGGRGAQERLRSETWPVLYRGSRYAQRLPIGQPDIIEAADPERLAAFYRDWYRPDLMAVIVVGDVAADRAEALVREHFAYLEPADEPRTRDTWDMPRHDETLAVVATDPEARFTAVNVTWKHPRRPDGTRAAYREGLVRGLFSLMLGRRLDEMTRETDAPFTFAGAGAGSAIRATDAFRAFAVAEDGGVERALAALLTEVRRVQVHGFTAGELERVVADYRTSMETAYRERDQRESSRLAAEYVRHVLVDEPVPGLELEYGMTLEMLPDITVADVNEVADEVFHAHDRVVSVTAPETEGVALPDEAALLGVVQRLDGTVPDPYVDEMAGAVLLADLPEPGPVVERRELEALGVTEVVLANGVTVRFKPTDFKADEILFRAAVPGGISRVAEADYSSASASPLLVQMMGVGGHSATDLQKLLAGVDAAGAASLGNFQHGLGGNARPQDLETALQLVHLSLTAPNRDEEQFAVFRERFRIVLANRDSDPGTRFADRLTRLNHGDHYMHRPFTVERLDEIDLDTALRVYRERFADVSDLTVYMVGALDLDTAIPLVERYLGSLPSAGGGLAKGIVDPGIRFPDGVVRETVRAGTEPRARTRITWPARLTLDEMEMFHARLATDILEIRLRDLLREELGSTYSVGVGYSYQAPYTGYATTSITFGGAPERVDAMVEAALEAVAEFQEEGPTDAEVAKVAEIERRAVETGLETNGYWLASFTALHVLGWDPERVLHRLDRIDEVTPGSIRDTVRHYFPADNFTVVSLLPAGDAGGDDGETR